MIYHSLKPKFVNFNNSEINWWIFTRCVFSIAKICRTEFMQRNTKEISNMKCVTKRHKHKMTLLMQQSAYLFLHVYF
jgi:hypothetical protein